MTIISSNNQIALSAEAVKYLNNSINKDTLVFQQGYSYLTFWMADRANKVYTSEYDYKKFCTFNFYTQNNAYHNVIPTFSASIEHYPSKLFDIIILEDSVTKEYLEIVTKNSKSKSIIVLSSIISLDLVLPLADYFDGIEHMWDKNYNTTILTLK